MLARLLTLSALLLGMAVGLLLQGNTVTTADTTEPLLVMFGAGEAYLPNPGAAGVPAVNLLILPPPSSQVHVPYIAK